MNDTDFAEWAEWLGVDPATVEDNLIAEFDRRRREQEEAQPHLWDEIW